MASEHETADDYEKAMEDGTTAEIARLRKSNADLLTALKGEHRAIDILLAMLLNNNRTIRPTQMVIWPDIVRGNAAIDVAEGREPRQIGINAVRTIHVGDVEVLIAEAAAEPLLKDLLYECGDQHDLHLDPEHDWTLEDVERLMRAIGTRVLA